MSWKIRRVKIDLIAANKIKQHGEKENTQGLMGQLCGVFNKEEECIHVSTSFPIPEPVIEEQETKEQQQAQHAQYKKNTDLYEQFMIKQLEQMKLDHSYVGWYNIGNVKDNQGSEQFWMQYKYQKDIPFAVYIICDPNAINNPFRCFRIHSNIFRMLNLNKNQSSIEKGQIQRIKLMESMFSEIEVEIVANPLQQLFMRQCHEQIKSVANFKYDNNELMIKQTRNMIDGLEELDQNQLTLNDEILKKKENEEVKTQYDLNQFIDAATSIKKINNMLGQSNAMYEFIKDSRKAIL